MNQDSIKTEREEKRPFLLRPVFWFSLSLGIVALFLHIIATRNVAFANALNGSLGASFRAVLSHLGALFPVSFAETLLLLSPVLLILLFLRCRRAARKRLSFARTLSALLSVPLLLYSLFVFSFGMGYYTTPLSERLELKNTSPSAENLYTLSLFLAERAEQAATEAALTVADGGSEMPFSYKEMNETLLWGYQRISCRYGFVQNYPIATKAVLLSTPMAYTRICGVYSFFTGEANVCTAYPDFCTVFTAAHEMAHARGIAREDEANFIAFLVCEASDHPYVRYAAYMNLLQYVSNALYDTSPQLAKEAFLSYSETVYAEMKAYNSVYKKFSGSPIAGVTQGVNNAYLESMGTEGSISYDMVVSLAVCYFDGVF